MRKEIEAVVLAGGRGQRMEGLVANKQKCLLEVDGKPILSHIFDNIISAFGSADVTVALGYRGEDVKNHYGERYRTLALSYVHDPRPLETRRRLLLAKDSLHSSFLFLASDILCHPEQLVSVAELYEREEGYVLGTLTGASFHDPAPTHALITIRDERAVQLTFPPTLEWTEDQYREMHVACYSQNFLGLLESVPSDVLHISHVISLALKQGREFQASKYFNRWYHYVDPENLKESIDTDYRLK
jgi:NDP-sugar pyrophosphorylase family protein